MNHFLQKVLLALLLTAPLSEAWAKFNISESYSITGAGVGTDGNKIVEVTGTAGNVKKAMEQARKNAVAAVIFRGIPAGDGTLSIPPMSPLGEQLYRNNAKYFDKFFDKEKTYLQFVNFTSTDIPSGINNVETRDGRRVTVYVQILYDNLRRRLEQDGILTSMSASAVLTGKKPVIMVVPETAWMKQHRYVDRYGNPLFRKALENDNDLRNCITEINSIMADRGYPMSSLEAKLDELDNEAARSSLATAKDGTYMQQSDLDDLSKVANADIFVTLAIESKTYGSRKYYEFRINSRDASSLKDIHGVVATSSPSLAPPSTLVKEGVLKVIDGFTNRLERHFEDIQTNGREGTLILKISSGAGMDFESEVTINGDSGELQEAIDYWLEQNTVNGQFSKTRGSQTTLVYEQVRMPLSGKGAFSKKSSSADAEKFARQLGSFLRQFGLSVRVDKLALGKAYIYIGRA